MKFGFGSSTPPVAEDDRRSETNAGKQVRTYRIGLNSLVAPREEGSAAVRADPGALIRARSSSGPPTAPNLLIEEGARCEPPPDSIAWFPAADRADHPRVSATHDDRDRGRGQPDRLPVDRSAGRWHNPVRRRGPESGLAWPAIR